MWFCLFTSLSIITSCYRSDNNDDTIDYKESYGNDDTSELINLGIDIYKTYQVIDGFGASDCMCGNYVGRDWTDSERSDIADLLFSQKIYGNQPEGIGLSMWRSNLGAGSANPGVESDIAGQFRKAECYLQKNGAYDWSLCAGQRYFMQAAKQRGCNNFVLFSLSPPIWYTKNGKSYSSSGYYANLKNDYYDKTTDYFAKVASHYKQLGYNISLISPVNETQFKWDTNKQEGTSWTNSEIARLCRSLDKSLTKEGLDTKILLSEAGSYKYLYESSLVNHSNQIKDFFNSSSLNYIGNLEHIAKIITGHSYWTDSNLAEIRSVRTKLHSIASSYGLATYQSEWSMLGAGYNGPHYVPYEDANDMDIAMILSQVIYGDLVYAYTTSWCFWTAMNMERYGQKDRFMLISLVPSDGKYGHIVNSGTHAARKTLWVLGNYSRFIRPGYKRVSISSGIDNDCYGTAFISPDAETLVVVMTNFKKTIQKFNPKIKDFKATSVKKYVTSESANLMKVDSDQDILKVPAKSVTTFVFSK